MLVQDNIQESEMLLILATNVVGVTPPLHVLSLVAISERSSITIGLNKSCVAPQPQGIRVRAQFQISI